MDVTKSIWKPNLYRLGLLLTLLVMVADWAGLLDWFERVLYDGRAKVCHYFTPPPTDRLVHLDIDDDTLTEIGAWPWSRATLARIIDEISLAKPKVIGMDMYFPDPQRDDYIHFEKGSGQVVANDELFAASVKRAGNVLIPISVAFEDSSAADPLLSQIQRLLHSDLEMDASQVVEALQRAGQDRDDLPLAVRSRLSLARQRAMLDRIDQEIQDGIKDLDVLRRKLVPKADAANHQTDASQLLEAKLPLAMAIHRMLPFRTALPDSMPLASAPREEAVNILKIADSLRYSGFVDIPASSNDGTVRSLPLLVNYRGGALPHMALGMACALLDVDVKNIRCTPNSIILPVPNRQPIIIPARIERSTNFGSIGAIVDVPYFGRSGESNWLTMYDYPAYRESRAHLKIAVIWKLIRRSDSIRRTNQTADRALKKLAETLSGVPELETYLQNIPDASDTATRLRVIDTTLKALMDFGVGDLLKKPPAELDAEDKKLTEPTRDLQDIAKINRESEELLAKDRIEVRKQLQDKAVFIDWTAVGRIDFYPTSLHPKCPGAVIQGVIVNGILTGELWRRGPRWVTALITFLIGLLITLLVALLPPWRALFYTILIMLGYGLINGELLFDYGNLIVGAAGPLAVSALVWFGLTLTNYIAEKRARSQIRKRFSSYVDPALVDYCEEHPDMDVFAGQVREMSVAFTDLAGFTTISEKLREATVPLLNSFMGAMVPVIRENRGYVNKFLGDGIMFFYGAPRENPDHAVDCVRTIINMRKALAGFNLDLKKRDLPLVGMRAGITTGEMVVGDAGSTKAPHIASDYTVLGDRVNLAARLEAANKFFGSNLLIIQRTRDLIGDRFLVRPIGKIVVKGKSEDVMCYEAICDIAEASAQQILHAQLSAKLVEAFLAGEFDDCTLICDELEEKTLDVEFATTYRKLCTKHLTEGFEGVFNGQIVLSEK